MHIFKHQEQQAAQAPTGPGMSLYYIVYPNTPFNEPGFREAFDSAYYKGERGKTQLTLAFSGLPPKVKQGYSVANPQDPPEVFVTVTPRGAFDKNDKNRIQTAVTAAAHQIRATSAPVSSYP